MFLIAFLPMLARQVAPVPMAIQAWEKRLAPGLLYRMEWNPAAPRIVDALRISLRSEGLHAYPQLAGLTVIEPGPDKGRGTVSQMVNQDGAIAGVNGDFFPFTGDPLGLMLRDGELLSAPYASRTDPEAHRVSFAWGARDSTMGVGKMQLRVTPQGGAPIPVEGFDEDGGPDRVTVDNSAVGLATAKAPNSYAIVSVPAGPWAPNSEIEGSVRTIGHDLTSRRVAAGQAVILATGKAADSLSKLQEGQPVKISLHVSGFDFAKQGEVVGGGPMLLRDGQIFIDYAEERFKKEFADGRHPRTAIGRTKSGDLWLVVIDGRSAMSVGASLAETAEIMLRLGCVDAMNLDGGGSTTFDLFGHSINRPSDGSERPVASGILVKGPRTTATADHLSLSKLRRPVRAGLTNHVSVVLGDPTAKRSVPNVEVVWLCSGAAWIDQGGNLHARGAGTAKVTALVRGQSLTADYAVSGAKPPEEPKPGGKDD